MQTFTCNNLEDRVIRIFISSTFSDMQEERNLLVSQIFPLLAKVASRRDVTIVPLDLRWGITEESALQGRVIETCLNEIYHSRPFFLGLIGSRYGSCLMADEVKKNKELLRQYEWLAQDMEKGLSITEIEIQYGVLRYPGDMDAFFYLKDGDDSISDNPEKLAKLKTSIRENGRYPVEGYTTPQELAKKVETAFRQVLDKHFPDKPLSHLEKVRLNQQAFMRSRRSVYVPISEAYRALDDFLQGDESHFVVTGESGMGKSSLIANWLERQEKKAERKIICHFVGNGGLDGNFHSIRQRLCDEIRNLYQLSQPDENQYSLKESEDELKELFMKIVGREPLLIVLDGINQLVEEENAKQLLWLPTPPSNVKYLFSTLSGDPTMNVFERLRCPTYTLIPLSLAQRKQLVVAYLRTYGKELSGKRVERIVRDPQSENTLVLHSLLDELITFGSHEQLDTRIDYYLAAQNIEDFFQRVLRRIEDDLDETSVRRILSLIAFSQSGLGETELMELVGLSSYDWAVFQGVFRNYFMSKGGLLTFTHHYMFDACRSRYAKVEQWARQEIIVYFGKQNDSRAWDELAYQYYALGDCVNLYTHLLHLEVFDFLYERDKYKLGLYWRLLLQTDKERYTPSRYLDYADKDKDGCYYNRLGIFFTEIIVDLPIALLFQKKTLEIQEEILGVGHPETVNIYNNIGLIYCLQGNYSQALEYYFKALTFGEAVGTLKFAIYNNIGGIYSCQGDYKNALDYYLKALTIEDQGIGRDTASIYSNIGSAFLRLGDYKNALDYFSKALSIQIRVLGKDYPDIARSYNNIGSIYFRQGDYRNALNYFFKALSIQEKKLGVIHFDTAISYNNIGQVYCAQGDYNLTLDYYFKALSIREQVLGIDHLDTAISYNNIGQVYYAQRDYNTTLDYYFKALPIYEKKLGIIHSKTATLYNDIGLIYLHQGNHKNALVYFFKALSVREKILGTAHFNTAMSYFNVGFCYFYQGIYDSALDYFLRALPIQEKALGINHPDVLMLYGSIGLVYSNQKKYEKALAYNTKVLSIQEKVLGINHPDTIASYNAVGVTYFSLGDYKKAFEYCFKALGILEKTLGPKHPRTIAYKQNIEFMEAKLIDNGNRIRAGNEKFGIISGIKSFFRKLLSKK